VPLVAHHERSIFTEVREPVAGCQPVSWLGKPFTQPRVAWADTNLAMHRAITALVVVLTSTITFHAAAEGARPKKAKPKKAVPTATATAEALPQLPPATTSIASPSPEKKAPVTAAAAPEAPAAPAPEAKSDAPAINVETTKPAEQDKPAASAPALIDRDAGRGFVLTFGSGPNYVGGAVGEGFTIGSVQMTFELKMGAYITRHFGVMGGVQAGYGKLASGCTGECSAYAYQLPIVAQYAFQGRRRGAYLEGGLGILSTLGAVASGDSKSSESLQTRSPVDLKLGVGFRFAPTDPNAKKDTTSGYDIRFAFDLGQYKEFEYSAGGRGVKGDIDESKQRFHYGIGLFFGYHFTP